ncbi:MAG: NPCBM/NEW2 domain-containing protein [Clostridia bacterium]|nr:NPCBM/NEW2 domain-containing protein [Clostridia bacterium]
MLNDKIKGILIGTLIGATLAGGTVIAANSTTLYDVITEGVKIVIDGKKLNPTDANGNAVEPIIYNGTTYLPVRAVATALGKAVYWDGPNFTVYLGDMDGELEYPTAYLKDMTNIGNKWYSTNDLTDNYGNRYSEAVYMYHNCYAEYLLNMKYSKFKATMYIPEGYTRNAGAYIKVIADGKTIYTSPEMDKTSHPVDIEVDVKGYNDVKIYCIDDYDDRIYLANAGVYQ